MVYTETSLERMTLSSELYIVEWCLNMISKTDNCSPVHTRSKKQM